MTDGTRALVAQKGCKMDDRELIELAAKAASATDGGHEGCWLMPNDGTQPAPTAAQEQR